MPVVPVQGRASIGSGFPPTPATTQICNNHQSSQAVIGYAVCQVTS